LIKVEASTVNPSDRGRISGAYMPIQLPAIMGLEGTGRVVEANGADIQNWVGKRVSFTQAGSGTWADYAISTPNQSF
jgi:NADPH:quinone reductase-like Zn-dependent oxidoreductase